MIARNFLDNTPNNHNIKKYSGYRSMEQRPKKLLEQVSDIIRLMFNGAIAIISLSKLDPLKELK
jgi:hypothetical protein